MKKNDIWEILEKILFFLLIIAFLFLSDSQISKIFCSIVLILNAIYIVVYVIRIIKSKKNKGWLMLSRCYLSWKSYSAWYDNKLWFILGSEKNEILLCKTTRHNRLRSSLPCNNIKAIRTQSFDFKNQRGCRNR